MNDLSGSTVLVIGGTSGIGLETARQARAAGATIVLTGRDPGRLEAARDELKALTFTVELDRPDAVRQLFGALPGPIDHVLVSGGGPIYAPIVGMDVEAVRRELDTYLVGSLRIAQECAARVRPGGSLTFISGTGARRPGIGLVAAAIGTAAMPALVANAALELAPIRVNAIAAGFVDTLLSARILGDDLEARRQQLRETLPIRRVVGPGDVAALALHLMVNTALTGATYDVDGGQQLVG